MKLTKWENNPCLSPNPDNYWEELVVCNPGVWYEDGTFHMLYRAAGDDEAHTIRFGHAISKDGFNFERTSDDFSFGPSTDGMDQGGVEDARIVKFGDYFYVTYAFRPDHPGQYWKFGHDEIITKDYGQDAPKHLRENIANSALAITKDFKEWRRLGRITSADLDDRDVILFPEKINGKYWMMHRPKQWIGEQYGPKRPAVWIRSSEDMLVWEDDSQVLLEGIDGTWEEKVGGSTPPLRTDRGWLVIYHGVENGGQGYYRVGAVMLDLEDPTKIIARTKDFIMEPEFDYEIEGYYKGCVFPTGNVILDDTLYVYYGGADKYVGVATANVNELIDHIMENPCE